MKIDTTAAEMLAAQVSFEGGDCDFGVDPMNDGIRKAMRGMAVHLLAVAATNETELQRRLDAVDEPTEQAAEDMMYEITSKAVQEHYESVLVWLGLTESDIEWG